MGIRDGIVTKEVLNLFILLDNSYSMIGMRINQVNSAMETLKKSLMKIAEDNGVEIMIRVISFSDEAVWRIGTVVDGVDITQMEWHDIAVDNQTCTNKAIREVNKALNAKYIGKHALRPVVILITDGYCNKEDHDDYLLAIEEMKKKFSGNTAKEKVTRIGVGVMDHNEAELVEFASRGLVAGELVPLTFNIDKVTDIGKVIDWVTVTSILSSITDVDNEYIDMGDPEWLEEDGPFSDNEDEPFDPDDEFK